MRFAEFFAGIGLVRMGLERVGWTCAFANDCDPVKATMYAGHFVDGPIVADVARLNPEDVPPVTMATASFPCTDLSLAGPRKGIGGSRSGTVWSFLDLLEEVRPRPPLIMLENVLGLVSSGGGGDLERLLRRLADLGYGLDLFAVDAAWFVPQSRPRLFVVGEQGARRCGLAEPSPTRPARIVRFVEERSFLPWALADLPSPPRRASVLADVLDHLPSDHPAWWSECRVRRLLDQATERHRLALEAHEGVATCFRRVRDGISRAEFRLDGVAGCLRTPKGGSAKQILIERRSAQTRARYLTARECARLMGADDYRISVPENSALFGFGDAVCVPVIEWIARHRLSHSIT
jgi:DNA (cytosine-5)-methyltransferase 1